MLGQDILFAVVACYAATCGGETLGVVARLGRVGQAQSAATEWKLKRRRLDSTWQAKQRWLEGQARMQETGDWPATWSAVPKLIGRKKRAFRPPAPMLGDEGKPLASLQAKANQHQRELMKEFGENCAELSVAEHLDKGRADKQTVPVEHGA